jgi:putative hydrolase of the HAD superfamily
MPTPQFLYFDLGNVLLHYDHRRAAAQMADVARTSPAHAWKALFDSGLHWRYERGELSSAEFCEHFCAATDTRADSAALLRACADIFEPNRPILPILAALRAAGWRMGILSNTNEAHWQFVSAGCFAESREFFELEVLSYQARCMKPEREIYEIAARRAGLPARQIFFVDDRPENVAGACQAGIDAVPFVGCEQLSRDLEARGIL